MVSLTVFTPTFNRKHTLSRTYASLCGQTNKDFAWLIIDDGSQDGTRAWVEGLGIKVHPKGRRFDWMGRAYDEETEDHFVIEVTEEGNDKALVIEYIYKPNGGLYSGYNVAYASIETELCVCVDSDDFMPDDAVEKILTLWGRHYPQGSRVNPRSVITGKEYCGIVGLDFDIRTGSPIGGYWPAGMAEGNLLEIESRGLHRGDSKQVMRTDLMRAVAPMLGFRGEKNFNPFYLLMQVCDVYPMLLANDNYCTVDYQLGADSMSQGIYRQYVNSPHSYAQYRRKSMQLAHTSWGRRCMLAAHYVSSCLMGRERGWLRSSPYPFLTLIMAPVGVALSVYIRWKARR